MSFIIRRLVYYVTAAWVAITANFVIPRAMPGDAVQVMIAHNRNLTPAAFAALRSQFGVDESGSILVQYGSYLKAIAHGDLGVSLSFYPTTVLSLLQSAIPYTLLLVGISTVLSFGLGTGLGILAGWRRHGALDRLLPVFAFLQAIPYFFLGIVVIEILALRLQWFPSGGAFDGTLTPGLDLEFIQSALHHAVLPAATIVLTSMAGWMLQMRNTMITTIGEDHVLVATAKGLEPHTVMLRYAARNAILPNLSGFALAIGFVLSGSLVMEVVFSYPGVGLLLYNAVTSDDYPLVQGIFLFVCIAVLVASFLADIAYAAADPRARTSGRQ